MFTVLHIVIVPPFVNKHSDIKVSLQEYGRGIMYVGSFGC